MTEAESWVSSEDPIRMLRAVEWRASERKLRLFLVAAALMGRDRFPYQEMRDGVEAAEQYADGQADARTLALYRGWYYRFWQKPIEPRGPRVDQLRWQRPCGIVRPYGNRSGWSTTSPLDIKGLCKAHLFRITAASRRCCGTSSATPFAPSSLTPGGARPMSRP